MHYLVMFRACDVTSCVEFIFIEMLNRGWLYFRGCRLNYTGYNSYSVVMNLLHESLCIQLREKHSIHSRNSIWSLQYRCCREIIHVQTVKLLHNLIYLKFGKRFVLREDAYQISRVNMTHLPYHCVCESLCVTSILVNPFKMSSTVLCS